MGKYKHIAKAVVAVAGFLVVAGNMVISGHFDSTTLIAAGTSALVALGVYHVPNKV